MAGRREPPAQDASLSFICPAVSEPVLGPEDTKKPLLVRAPPLPREEGAIYKISMMSMGVGLNHKPETTNPKR